VYDDKTNSALLLKLAQLPSQSELDAANAKIAELNSKIISLNAQIALLNNKISTQVAEIAELNKKILWLKNEVSRLTTLLSAETQTSNALLADLTAIAVAQDIIAKY
jgi:peptidoglycan hydrolase CwlO-like protein